jgi:hypothetical protein
VPPVKFSPGQRPRVTRSPTVKLGQLCDDVSPIAGSVALKLSKKSPASFKSRWHRLSTTFLGTTATIDIRFMTTPILLDDVEAFSNCPAVGSCSSSFS